MPDSVARPPALRGDFVMLCVLMKSILHPLKSDNHTVDTTDGLVAINWGDNWSIEMGAERSDYRFPRFPADYPANSLLLNENGPVAIALQAPSGKPCYYIFESKTVVMVDPAAKAISTAWHICIPKNGVPERVVTVAIRS